MRIIILISILCVMGCSIKKGEWVSTSFTDFKIDSMGNIYLIKRMAYNTDYTDISITDSIQCYVECYDKEGDLLNSQFLGARDGRESPFYGAYRITSIYKDNVLITPLYNSNYVYNYNSQNYSLDSMLINRDTGSIVVQEEEHTYLATHQNYVIRYDMNLNTKKYLFEGFCIYNGLNFGDSSIFYNLDYKYPDEKSFGTYKFNKMLNFDTTAKEISLQDTIEYYAFSQYRYPIGLSDNKLLIRNILLEYKNDTIKKVGELQNLMIREYSEDYYCYLKTDTVFVCQKSNFDDVVKIVKLNTL